MPNPASLPAASPGNRAPPYVRFAAKNARLNPVSFVRQAT